MLHHSDLRRMPLDSIQSGLCFGESGFMTLSAAETFIRLLFRTRSFYRATMDGHSKWDSHGLHQMTAGGIGSTITSEIINGPDAFKHLCVSTILH